MRADDLRTPQRDRKVISIICTYIDLVREDGYLDKTYRVYTSVFRRPRTYTYARTCTYAYTHVRS